MAYPTWHGYPSVNKPTFELAEKEQLEKPFHTSVVCNTPDSALKTVDLGKHYSFEYKGIKLDPYRIFTVYNITNPAQQHALKKLLRAGTSVKSLERDIDEVIVTLNRWKQMLIEDQQ